MSQPVDERLVEVCIFKDMRSIVGDGLACRLGRCFCLRQRSPPEIRTLGIPFSFTPVAERVRGMYRNP